MRFLAISSDSVGGGRGAVARGSWAILGLVLLSVGYIFASREGDVAVVVPAVVLLDCACLFLFVLSLPAFEVPVFEIGSMFAGVVTIYGVMPLFQYQLRNGIYGSASDSRLWVSQPTAEEVGLVGWAHVVFFVVFAAGYLLVRRGKNFEVLAVEEVGKKQLLFAGIFLGVVMVLQFGIELAYDLSYSTYTESYLVGENLPHSVNQVYGHLPGVAFTLKLMIFCGILLRVPNPVRVIGIWLGVEFALLLFKMGWRTYFMLSLGAAILFFHAYVRRVSALALAGAGCVILSVFLFLGVVRNSSLEAVLAESGLWEQSNEMEAVFANSLDLMQQMSRNMISLPPEALVSEVTVFIPQQFLPFQKFDYSQWYARMTFKKEGQTSAFGVISQSLAGFGWWELVVRGLLTGLLFAGLHRYFSKHSGSWLHTVAYAWLIVMSYHSFRATSLQPVAVFVLEALPVFLVMLVIPRPDLGTRLIRLRGA